MGSLHPSFHIVKCEVVAGSFLWVCDLKTCHSNSRRVGRGGEVYIHSTSLFIWEPGMLSGRPSSHVDSSKVYLFYFFLLFMKAS